MDNKRILIAVVLSFIVLYAFRWIYPVESPAPPAPVADSAPAPASPVSPAPAAVPAPERQKASSPQPADIQAESEVPVVIDNDLYTATLSNTGGVLKSFKLKAPYTDADKQPIELIDHVAAEKLGWPLAILSGDAVIDALIGRSNFVTTRTDADKGEKIVKIVMEFAGEGVHAQKTMEFDRERYQFHIATKLSMSGENLEHRVVWQAEFGDQSIEHDPLKQLAVVDTAPSKFERLAVGKLDPPVERTSSRVGMEDQYFAAILLLPDPAGFRIGKATIPTADGKTVDAITVNAPMPAKGMDIYVGPKASAWLEKTDLRLSAVLDYGFFGFLTKPLIGALLFIHRYVGNFGWSIVILTFGINLILLPLRLKQQLSMQKMQKLQPKMKTLQDKYKKLKATDPRRAEVQKEMMGLYSEHGVNPMGGCFPLLLQLPFLWAFWSMLSVSIELRRAPWILWIRDLSQYDPYYVIPILMAVSMVVMQKMTPSTLDPTQAKIMMIMPVFFTYIFLKYQSGLQLYWLTSNVAGVGQQLFISKYWTPRADAKQEKVVVRKKAEDGS